MEAVAYGDQTMRFDDVLVQGAEYRFTSVGFLRTWVDEMHQMFRLHSDFYVHLSEQTMVHAHRSIRGFAPVPRMFMAFQDVYTLDEFIFAGISHTSVCKITSLIVFLFR